MPAGGSRQGGRRHFQSCQRAPGRIQTPSVPTGRRGVIGESDDDDEEDDEVEDDESDSDGNGGIDEAGGHGKDRVSAAARAATSDAAAAKRRRKKRHDPYVDPSTAVVESLLRRIGALNKRWARGGGP